jgi:phosphoglycolate phosphatase-like HAD superfamily hydrolase
MTTSDPLPSWNDGPVKGAIVDFVARVTDAAGPGFVPPAERVAVFDNDGTLWCEKPMYIQLAYLLQRLAAMAERDPALRDRQPWRAAYEKDYQWLGGVVTKHDQGDDSDLKMLLGGILASADGDSVDAIGAEAGAYLRAERHPTLGRRYVECGYRPMVELLRYLEANGFASYIASGGGRDFMRAVTEEIYGIPPERVIGSAAGLRYQADERGGAVVLKAELELVDDGPVKPVRIWSRVGRRPILAAGNSNGDIEMLAYVEHESRPSLSLLVRHDDAAREFAYTAGAERALDEAARRGWTVVSVKDDWAAIFADEARRSANGPAAQPGDHV